MHYGQVGNGKWVGRTGDCFMVNAPTVTLNRNYPTLHNDEKGGR